MRIRVLIGGLVLLGGAVAAQQAINPRQQPGAMVHIFAPEQHDLYDGHFIISANRIYMVGGLNEQFTEERIADPAVCELASRIEVEVDPEMDAVYPERYAGIVSIVLDDGRRLRKRVDYSKGMPENRMTIEDLHAKFRSLAGAAVGTDAAASLLDRTIRIFDTADVSDFAHHLGALRLTTEAVGAA